MVVNTPDCVSDINECASNPCNNGGSCSDLVNGYTCECVEGYAGLDCDYGEIDSRSNRNVLECWQITKILIDMFC